jgi:hypothetical protein
LSDKLNIVGAGVEVLVGEVEIDPQSVDSGRTNNTGSDESRGPEAVALQCGGFLPPLSLSDRSRE